VFQTSIDGILLTAPDGRILSANPAACRMLGYDESGLRALGPGGPIDPADPRWPSAQAERASAGRFAGELSFLRQDGSSMPGEVSSALFEDSYGQRRGSLIVRDITEPIMAPLRRVIPMMGMMDFSPIVAILLLQVLEGLVRQAVGL
jgi:PAS domain S-box-containing protein